jgi:hypothetical protein
MRGYRSRVNETAFISRAGGGHSQRYINASNADEKLYVARLRRDRPCGDRRLGNRCLDPRARPLHMAIQRSG